jgi:hypothetical protein
MQSASVRAAVAAAVVVSVPVAFVAWGDEASTPDSKPAAQADSHPSPTQHTVRLYTSADLDQLRQTNPSHYSRVQKILANASDSLCKPGALQLQHAEGSKGVEAQCAAGLVMTSNPPKRQLSFRVDDTTYIAVVTLRNADAHLLPAQSSPQTGASMRDSILVDTPSVLVNPVLPSR